VFKKVKLIMKSNKKIALNVKRCCFECFLVYRNSVLGKFYLFLVYIILYMKKVLIITMYVNKIRILLLILFINMKCNEI